MSQKINAKNLQYNSSLPPFLARLRGQEAESRAHGGPDPMLAGHRRIGKPRSASAEAEDAPLVVDERGEVVNLGDLNKSEEEDETGEKTVEAGKKEEATAGGDDIAKSKKKRKLGRVIGGRDEDEEEDEQKNDEKSKTKKDYASSGKDKLKTENTKSDGKKDTASGNKKKKAKKIKLSFGDDEEEG